MIASLLRREARGPVEADDLAVELALLADVLDQGRVLGGLPHPLPVRDLRSPVCLELAAEGPAPGGLGGADHGELPSCRGSYVTF